MYMLSMRRVVAYCSVYYICTIHEERTHVYSGYGQRIFGLETNAGWAVKTEDEANVVLYREVPLDLEAGGLEV